MAASQNFARCVRKINSWPICFSLKSYTSAPGNGDNLGNGDEHQKRETCKKKNAQAASKKLADLILQLKVEPNILNHESELNLRLARPPNLRDKQEQDTLSTIKKEEEEKFVDVDASLAAAIQSVASSIGGDTKQTESELIRALRSYKKETQEAKSVTDISGLLSGMKTEKKMAKDNGKAGDTSPLSYGMESGNRKLNQMTHSADSQQLLGSLRERNAKKPISREILHASKKTQESRQFEDLFSGPPLAIFTKPKEKIELGESKEVMPVTIWETCEKRELQRLFAAPPRNAFEEMINWTEQGKLWKFPIDNEQGMEAEVNVPFHEHVFLEKHLQDGFPPTGPVRHFMELVCVGLSKNPYMLVERKLEHIQWYRDYFRCKEAVLKDMEIVSQN